MTRKALRCPGCGKPTQWEGNPSRPFCSERCRLIDLGAWVNEEYRVPGEEQHNYDGDDDSDKE